jgi:adenylate cyclase, class 2
MIEAELKARVRDADQVRGLLARLAPGRRETYHDTYYERPGGGLADEDRELRLREIDSDAGARALLTYKEPRVDHDSGSKPEFETAVSNPDALRDIFAHLGYTVLISFTKHCENHEFTAVGRHFLATLVTVPELDGTFLELETEASEIDLDSALSDVRAVMGELGIAPQDYTTEAYTDAVATSGAVR